MGLDIWYWLLIVATILSLVASAKVNSTFQKYAQIRSKSNMTGAQVAQRLLHANGIYDVGIEHISGNLTDHYDPSAKVLRLSNSVYDNTSVAAIAVAAHECGHAVQHNVGYAPISIRSKLVPIANFGAKISWPLILIGLLIGGSGSVLLLQIGIILFSASVLFQIVTLPVEFNASSRALKFLESNGILASDEHKPARKVLSAAAMTYVAAAAVSVIQLLRLVAMMNRRRD